MFDFRKVIDVADYLAQKDGEEYHRSAISRYYYSLFGCTRLYLIFIMHETEFVYASDIHRRICDRLKNSLDATENALGRILDDLRQIRNVADYDWEEYDYLFFKNRLTFVQKESSLAFDNIDALKKSPPYKV